MLSLSETFAAANRRVIPPACWAELKAGDIFGLACAPLLHVPVSTLERSETRKTDHMTASAALSFDNDRSPVKDLPPGPVRQFEKDQRNVYLRIPDILPLRLGEISSTSAERIHQLRWSRGSARAAHSANFLNEFSKPLTPDLDALDLLPFNVNFFRGEYPGRDSVVPAQTEFRI